MISGAPIALDRRPQRVDGCLPAERRRVRERTTWAASAGSRSIDGLELLREVRVLDVQEEEVVDGARKQR